MKTRLAVAVIAALVSLLAFAPSSRADAKKKWEIKADYIEACSCPLFCSCYFYAEPTGKHHCEFNNAVRVASGHVGDVKVDGCKFWLSGDLGGDFSDGEMDGGIITWDPAVTKEQKEALKFLIEKIYPVKWKSLKEDTAEITWEMKDDGSAHAKVGDKGEVKLEPAKVDGKQTVVENLKYWGAQKNNGFRLCYGTHWYKGNGYDYKYEKQNGFTIHIESSGEEDMKK